MYFCFLFLGCFWSSNCKYWYFKKKISRSKHVLVEGSVDLNLLLFTVSTYDTNYDYPMTNSMVKELFSSSSYVGTDQLFHCFNTVSWNLLKQP